MGSLGSRRQVWTVIAASLAVALSATTITLRFPVYFHWDDVVYLQWAQLHSNPLAAFQPSISTLCGTFRPALLLTWWVLYRLFGLHSWPYQLFLTLLYTTSLAVFFLVLRRMYSRSVAVLGLFTYLLLFFPLSHVIFWYSDLTFVQELLFLMLSLYCFQSLFDRRRPGPLWGLLFYLCAILTKEPSVVIVTSVLVTLAWARWEGLSRESRRRWLWVVSVVAVMGLAWLLLSPSVRNRQGLREMSTGAGTLRFMAIRWGYYAGTLLAQAGLLLWIGVLFLGAKTLLPRRLDHHVPATGLLLLLASGGALLLKRFPPAALLILLAVSILAIVRRKDLASGVVWGFGPLFGLLMLAFYTRVYLLEASFGLAILAAIAGEEIRQSFSGLGPFRGRRAIRIAAVLLLVAFAIPVSRMVGSKLAALQVLSDNRQNFRDVSTYLLRQPKSGPAGLGVVSYQDMGVTYGGDVHFTSDEVKVGFQKTMEPEQLQLWLQINGRPDLRVIPSMKEYLLAAPKRSYVWAMNTREKNYLDRLPLRRTLVYDVQRRGQGAWLYLVQR